MKITLRWRKNRPECLVQQPIVLAPLRIWCHPSRWRAALGMWRHRIDFGWPPEFEALAVYNAEVARGVKHSEETRERMARIQDDFNAWEIGRFYLQHPGAKIITLDGGVLATPEETLAALHGAT